MSEASKAIKTVADLIAVCDLKVQRIHIDALDSDMFFRELAVGNLDIVQTINDARTEDGNVAVSAEMILNVLQASICDEVGELLFDSDGGRVTLKALPFAKMQEMFIAASKALMLTQVEVDEKKSS